MICRHIATRVCISRVANAALLGIAPFSALTGNASDNASLVAYLAAQITAALEGLKWKDAVQVATTANGTLASAFANGQTVDGIVLTTGMRILLKNQTAQAENGIYLVSASGAPTRSSDANGAAELEGATVTVQRGDSNANTTWTQTTDGITLGSSNIVWAQFGSSVPDATDTTKGILKLYPTPDGTNTDGGVSQSGLNAKFRLARTVTGTDGLLQADDNAIIIFNSATPFNFTIDQLTANSKVSFINIGAGAVTFINGTGVTLSGGVILPGAFAPVFPSCSIVFISATTPLTTIGAPLLSLEVPDTTGGTITEDCKNQQQCMFVGSASFAGPKTIAHANDTNTLVKNSVYTLTNLAAVITFPTSYTMQANDSRWNNGAHTFTPAVVGKHEFSATWDGTDWNLKVTSPYS